MAESGVGATIGRYRLDGLLGRGGMGEVYRAFDTERERSVALKLLLEPLAHDDEYVARFRREARLAARLYDPHILPIHDFGELEGRLFIDMRMVDGPDLAEVGVPRPVPNRTGPRPSSPRSRAPSTPRTGRAVHRDVKPATCCWRPTTRVRLPHRLRGGRRAGRSDRLTSTGTVIGTVAYLAPESFEGVESGPASDIYALGCVLAETLLGHPPFQHAHSPAEALHAHFSEPPPRPSRFRTRTCPRCSTRSWRGRWPRTRGSGTPRPGSWVRRPVGGPGERVPGTHRAAPAPRRRGRPASPRRPAAGTAAAACRPAAGPTEAGGEGPARTVATRLPAPPPLDLPAPQPGRWALRPDYQPTPGPLRYPSPLPFLGHQHVVDDLRARLRFAPGGRCSSRAPSAPAGRRWSRARSTSCTPRWCRRRPSRRRWSSSGSRSIAPTSPEELLARLVRGLAEALERAGIVARLPPEVAELLDTAHRRALAPFALADLERDLVALLAALAAGPRSGSGPSRRWFRRGGAEPWTGRVVVVLDDVDRLTVDGPGMASFETILPRPAPRPDRDPGRTSCVVAGIDVLDAARRSDTRGGTIYSAVFGRQLYLDSLPRGAAAELLRGVLLAPGPELETLAEHLEYRSRGIPAPAAHRAGRAGRVAPGRPARRRRPGARDLDRLPRRPRTPGRARSGRSPARAARSPDHLDIDRRRSATYLVVDWALDRRGTTFTASDLVADRVAGGHRRDLASDDECVGLLRELAAIGILTAREPDSPQATFVGTPGPTETVYRLSRPRRRRPRPHRAAAPRARPRRRRALRPARGARPGRARADLPRARHLHHAATSRSRCSTSGSEHDDVARERFRRGADLARRLGHPLLATTLGTLEDGGRLGLVAEFVPGLGLDELLERGPLAPPVAVDLTLGLLDLMHHLHGAGVVRLDLAPSHIVVTPDGRPVVVGLGPAHRVDDARADRGRGRDPGLPRPGGAAGRGGRRPLGPLLPGADPGRDDHRAARPARLGGHDHRPGRRRPRRHGHAPLLPGAAHRHRRRSSTRTRTPASPTPRSSSARSRRCRSGSR